MRQIREIERFAEIEQVLQGCVKPIVRALSRLSRPLSKIAFFSKPFKGVLIGLLQGSEPDDEYLSRSYWTYCFKRDIFIPYVIVITLFVAVFSGMHLISKPDEEAIEGPYRDLNVYIPGPDRFITDNPPGARTDVPQGENQFGQGFLGFKQLIPIPDQQPVPDKASPVYALGEDNYDSTLPTSYSPIAGDGIGIYPAFSTTVLMEQLTPRPQTITPPPSPVPTPTDWKGFITQSRQQMISNIDPPIVKPDTALVAKFADSLGLTGLYALVQLCINAYDGYDSIQIIEEKPQNKGVGEIIKRALLNGSCRSAKQRNGSGVYTYVPSIRYFTYTVTKGRIAGAYISGDPNYLKIVLPQN